MSDSRITELWRKTAAAKALIQEIQTGAQELLDEDPAFSFGVKNSLTAGLDGVRDSWPGIQHARNAFCAADVLENRETA